MSPAVEPTTEVLAAAASFDALDASAAVIDSSGTIVATNRAWRLFSLLNGGTSSDDIGLNYLAVCDLAGTGTGTDARDARVVAAGIRDVISGRRERFGFDYPCSSPLQDRWLHLKCAPALTSGRAYFVVKHSDISAKQQLEKRLGSLAVHDPLTALPNRLAVTERLAANIRVASRTGDAVAVIVVAIQGIHDLEDELGRSVCDDILIQVAARLVRHVRSDDILARLDEQSFLVLARNIDAEQTQQRATDIETSLGEPFQLGSSAIAIGAGAFAVRADGSLGAAEVLGIAADGAVERALSHGGSPARPNTAQPPLSALLPARAMARIPLRAVPAESNRFTVLVIDHDPADIDSIEAMLLNQSTIFEVRRATSEAEGLDELRRQPADAVLLHLGLPDAEQLDDLTAILALNPDVPVIVLTNEESDYLGYDLLIRGAQNFLLRRDLDAPLLQRLLLSAVERSLIRLDLRRSEAHYRSVFEALGEGVLVQGPDGSFISINAAAIELLGIGDHIDGVSASEPTLEILDGDGNRLADEDRPGRACLQTGRPVLGGIYGIGHSAGVERWIELDARPLIHRGQTTPYAVVSTMRDVTARLEAERKVRDAERRRQIILANVTEGYRVLDQDGRVLEANPPLDPQIRLLATDGGLDFDRLHPDDRQLVQKIFFDVREQPNASYAADIRVVLDSGECRWFEFRVTNHLDEPTVSGLVVNYRDVTQRRHELDSMQIQSGLLDAAGQAIIGTDADGLVSFWNKAATQIYGWTSLEALGHPVAELIPGEESDAAIAAMVLATANGQPWTGELRIRRRDGSTFPASLSTTPLYSDEGTYIGTIGVSTDLTEKQLAAEKLSHQANHDPLTGLPNRTFLISQLDQALAHRRTTGDPVTVCFIDLDHFKVVNDGIGHNIGDQVLVIAARRLNSALRSDFVCRFGGDEFVVVCADSSPSYHATLPDRILATFAEPFAVPGNELVFTASIGVARATDTDTSDTMIRDADAAMNQAKQGGRNRIEIFDESVRQRASARLELERNLRHALERHEFTLVYQPIVALDDVRAVGFEALIRWNHPERGLVSPDEFIPLAESTGLIIGIGEWVMREAIDQLALWHRELDHPELWMAINLSPRQLNSPTLLEAITSTIENSGVSPHLIHFEVTETALMDDFDLAIAALRALRSTGVELAVDDFGTGYSSLTYLKQLPVDVLKIDRSFVDGLGTDPDDSSIVRAIVSLGQALELTVLAEGVETDIQFEALRELGCDLGQGYLWSRPLPPTQVAQWLSLRPRAAPRQSGLSRATPR